MIQSMIVRLLLALAAFGMAASPVAAQIDPAARGLAVQNRQQVQAVAREASIQGASLTRWRACRGKLRTGAIQVCRIAFFGDSKTFGAGAGTGATFLDNSFSKARPYRVGELLAVNGIPARQNSWFGTGGMGSIAAVLSYDPRRSGFSGWGGGSVSLGGPAMSSGVTNPGNFQPSVPVDRVSVFYQQGSSQGQFTVAKGSETTTINASNATSAIIRAEITFNTKDANPIVITRTAGGFLNLIGMVAWDSATPGVELGNMGIYGTKTDVQAQTANAWSPAAALKVYGPALTVINLGTNDVYGVTDPVVPLDSWLASMQVIVTAARASGDCLIEWPSIISTNYGDTARRTVWRNSAQNLAVANGCAFQDDEALLGGRDGAAAIGAMPDNIHEYGFAYDIEAQGLLRYLLQ